MRFARPALSLSVLAVVGQMVACGDASGPETPPATILIVSGNAQAPTEVGTALPQALRVRVLAADSSAIRGVPVTWATESGAMAAPTSLTDGNGIAQMQWTLGPVAGSQSATASVAGKFVTFTQIAIAGPFSQIVFSRDTVLLLGVGDSFRLIARAADRFGNAVPVTTQLEVADTSGVRAEIFGNTAFLTARAPDTRTTFRATAGSLTRTGTIVVLPPPCRAGAQVSTLGVGETVLLTGRAASEFCLQGTSSGAEFIAVPFFSDFSGSLLRVSISTGGSTTAAAANLALPGFQISARLAPVRLERDEAFELDLRERSRQLLTPLMPLARAADGQSSGRFSVAAAPPKIGDLLNLNTNASSPCANARMRTGRVVAISDRAVVVADTANPVNGFTTQDYEYFAVGFDTLVYPVDTLNFGSPTDKDGNQRVLLFFTRAVNELTPPGQSFYIGGFFFSRDLFPRTASGGVQGCEASNVAEMLYLLVPDPNGVVNQNARSVEFVKGVTLGTVAHELQHLINSSRHLYVNASPTFEDVFVDEGLSHEAEELVFFRAAGLSPAQNIAYEGIQSSQRLVDAFNTFAAANMRRFREFLGNPLTNAPYASNASLSTRGAMWSFLRYAADRRGGSESQLWFQLANPPAGVHGIANLNRAITTDLSGWIRDWTVANYADDYISGVTRVDTHPSWNMRSVVTAVNEGMWALDTQPLDSSRITSVTIGDGSAAYLRFGVRPGSIGGGRITARAGFPPDAFALTVIRTK